MKGALREKIYWQLPAWLWGLFIFALTSLPKLTPPSLGFELEDKVYHFIVYTVLGLLIARATVQGGRESLRSGIRRMLWISIPLSFIDEVHQAFIPGRFCDGLDALADILGLLLVAIIFVLWGSRLAEKDRSIYCNLVKCDT